MSSMEGEDRLSLVFPEVSYKHMSIILDYFYTGVLSFTSADRMIVKDLLVNMLQIPLNRRTVSETLERISLVSSDTPDEDEAIGEVQIQNMTEEIEEADKSKEDTQDGIVIEDDSSPPSPSQSSSSSNFSGIGSSADEDDEENNQ